MKLNSAYDSFDALLEEAAHETSLLLPGTRLLNGRFVLQKLLGSGGMGVVYEAMDKHLQKKVVIKTLSSVSSENVYRLKKEFRSLVDVVHPHLVGLHELFVDGKVSFFSMDRIYGESLTQYLGVSPSSGVIKSVFSQLADGINAIHNAGKLHRDLKPNNVMITQNQHVVILDFGLACDLARDDPTQTIGNDLSGTPIYMAPEQAAGKPATRAGDWYAFGVMLFEVLDGRPPFNGSSQSIIIQKNQRNAPPLKTASADLGPGVTALCDALLSRDPDKRPDFEAIRELFPLEKKSVDHYTPQGVSKPSGFVGREMQLIELMTMLKSTNTGRPAVALVSGDSGVGKTALLKQFADQRIHEKKAVVLSGRCYQRENIPYKGCDTLLDAMSRYLMLLPVERAATLLPRNVHALRRVFPVFGRLEAVRRTSPRLPLPPDPTELKRRGEAALKELFCRLAEQEQVILIIDDFQWSDQDGARLISSLLLPPDAPPIMWIVAFRAESTAPHGGEMFLLDALEKQDDVFWKHMPLVPFDREDSALLAKRLLPGKSEEVVSSVAAQSEGSPFLISMLSRHINAGRTAGCNDVRAAVEIHTEGLSKEVLEVFEAVCIAGGALSVRLLQQILPKSDVASAVRTLLARRLIRSNSEPAESIGIYHQRFGEAFLEGVSPESEKRWHRQFAQAIAAGEDSDPIALTHHYIKAEELLQAAQTAVSAAAKAEDLLAFDQAVTLYDIALTHGQLRGRALLDIHIRRAEALMYGIRAAEAGDAFLKASEIASSSAEKEVLRRRGGEQLLLSGRLTEGFDIIKGALAAHGLDYVSLISEDCDSLYSSLLDRGFEFEHREEKDVAPEQLRKLDMLWCACFGLSQLKYNETFALSFRYAMEALDTGVKAHIIKSLLGVSVFEACRMTDNTQVFSFLKRLCEEEASSTAEIYLRLAEGNIALFLSNPSAMKRAAGRALTLISESVGLSRELSMARTLMVVALYKTFDFDELARKGRAWLVETERQQNRHLSTWISIYFVVYYFAKGRPDLSRKMLNRAASYFDGSPPELVNTAMNQHRVLCDAFEGRTAGLLRIRDLDDTLNRSFIAENPLKRTDQAYFKGLTILRLIGEQPDKAELLEEVERAAQTLDGFKTAKGNWFSFEFWRPQAALLRAGIAAMRGDRSRAIKELEEALALFEHVEASEGGKAVAMIRLGELTGGTEGETMVQEAITMLRRLGIVDIDRYVDLFAPVFLGGGDQ